MDVCPQVTLSEIHYAACLDPSRLTSQNVQSLIEIIVFTSCITPFLQSPGKTPHRTEKEEARKFGFRKWIQQVSLWLALLWPNRIPWEDYVTFQCHRERKVEYEMAQQ